MVDPVVERFGEMEPAEQAGFKGALSDYVRLYAFLSQIVRFTDAGLEKLYVFGRMLRTKLPASDEELPREIQQAIDIGSYRIEKEREGKLELERGARELEPMLPKDGYELAPEELEALSQIIKELNDRFGTGFTDEDKVFIEQLQARLSEASALEASVRVNAPENARLTFDHVVNDRLQEMIDSNFKFYEQIADDPDFARVLLDWLFERYLEVKRVEAGE